MSMKSTGRFLANFWSMPISFTQMLHSPSYKTWTVERVIHTLHSLVLRTLTMETINTLHSRLTEKTPLNQTINRSLKSLRLQIKWNKNDEGHTAAFDLNCTYFASSVVLHPILSSHPNCQSRKQEKKKRKKRTLQTAALGAAKCSQSQVYFLGLQHFAHYSERTYFNGNFKEKLEDLPVFREVDLFKLCASAFFFFFFFFGQRQFWLLLQHRRDRYPRFTSLHHHRHLVYTFITK